MSLECEPRSEPSQHGTVACLLASPNNCECSQAKRNHDITSECRTADVSSVTINNHAATAVSRAVVVIFGRFTPFAQVRAENAMCPFRDTEYTRRKLMRW